MESRARAGNSTQLMKTQKKSRQAVHLQKKNSRWKWMAGATAATAAGATASQAGLVTITIGDSISSGYQGHFNADLTGDGHPDLSIVSGPYYAYRTRNVKLNGIQAAFRWTDASASRHSGWEQLGSRGASWVWTRHPTADGGYVTNRYGTSS
jgi:hypothetical protein